MSRNRGHEEPSSSSDNGGTLDIKGPEIGVKLTNCLIEKRNPLQRALSKLFFIRGLRGSVVLKNDFICSLSNLLARSISAEEINQNWADIRNNHLYDRYVEEIGRGEY